MKLITLGPKGTYSYEVTKKHAPNAEILLEDTLDLVFETFLNGDAEICVVPLENTLSGPVEQTQKWLEHKAFFIYEVIDWKISHLLVGWIRLEDAQEILVHPHTYKQCQKTLQTLCPQCRILLTKSNGDTLLQFLKGKDKDFLAIIPSHAKLLSQVPILKEEVEDEKNNFTRFIVLGKKDKIENNAY